MYSSKRGRAAESSSEEGQEPSSKKLMQVNLAEFQKLKLPLELNHIEMDIHTQYKLLSGEWLNDEIIDCYNLYLSKIKFKKENVVIYSTYFMPSLTRAVEEGNVTLKGIQRPRSIDIFKKDLVMVPANIFGVHWILILITNPNYCSYVVREFFKRHPVATPGDFLKFRPLPQLIILDSILPTQYNPEQFFSPIRRFLEVEFNKHISVKIEITKEILPGRVLNYSLQDNSSDCGIHVLHNIEKILEEIQPSCKFTDDMIPVFDAASIKGKRQEIFDVFCSLAQNQTC